MELSPWRVKSSGITESKISKLPAQWQQCVLKYHFDRNHVKLMECLRHTLQVKVKILKFKQMFSTYLDNFSNKNRLKIEVLYENGNVQIITRR